MAVMNIEQVSADMPLSPLYIIHGEEDLLRIEALDTLRAAAKNKATSTVKSLQRTTAPTGTNSCKAQAARGFSPI